MQRRTQFRSPLVGWPRRSGVGPETSFGHRFLRPIALIVVIGFVLVDAFLVIRLTQDDSTTSTRPGSSVNDSGPMTTSDRLGKQLGDLDQTEIGTPIIAGKAVARLQGNDRSERKPRHEASAAGAETVVSSSTSSTGTSASGSSSGGSSSGGSSSGGSSSARLEFRRLEFRRLEFRRLEFRRLGWLGLGKRVRLGRVRLGRVRLGGGWPRGRRPLRGTHDRQRRLA